MTMIKSQNLVHNFYSSLPEQCVPNVKQFGGFSCKPKILRFKPKPLTLNESLLFTADYKSRRKWINVTTTDAPFIRTFEFLDAYEDEYDGVIVHPESLPSSANAFSAILQSSISCWKLKGKKGVWLKILEEKADLVPIALKEGFNYHHAEPGYVMLTYWIPDGPCMLPSTATHQVGIGAFVVNENSEVLVVREKKCPLTCRGIWKMPTGFVSKSEEISFGAVREVKEETGIDTTFLEVVAFRHAHHVLFGNSDLFFVCLLKPSSTDITVDESEIQAAQWMPLKEFINQPFYQEDAMLKSITDVCVARHGNRYQGFAACQLMSKFDDKLSYLYCADLKGPSERSQTNEADVNYS